MMAKRVQLPVVPFDTATLVVSKKNINKTIRHYEKDCRESIDPLYIQAKKEKIRLLRIIRDELKELINTI